MSRPFSAFNIPLGARLEATHIRTEQDRQRGLTDDEKYAALRLEVLDGDELTFDEAMEPPR